MRGRQLVDAAIVALLLAAGVGGPAQAADAALQDVTNERASGTVAEAGDQIMVSCPAGLRAVQGNPEYIDNAELKRTHYRSEPTSDGIGWIVRVVSTEKTAPWRIDMVAHCESGGVVNETAIVDFVEAPDTVTSRDDEVLITCPTGYKAEYGHVSPGFNRSGITADGNGFYAQEICEWNGEAITASLYVRCRQ